MKEEIKIPAMGESVTEATIASFLKKDSDQVHEGEEIVELETEKVNQLLYSPASGILNWRISEGDSASIGDTIGYIDTSEQPAEKKEESKPRETIKKEEVQEKKVSKENRASSQKIRTDKEEFLSDLKKTEEKVKEPQADFRRRVEEEKKRIQ